MRLRTKLFIAWSTLMVLLWAATLWQVQRSVTLNFDRAADASFAATRRGVDAVQAEHRNQMRQSGWLLMNIPELRALIAEAGSDLSAANVESLNERLDTLSEMINVDLVCVVSRNGSLIAQNANSPFSTLNDLAAFLTDSSEATGLVRDVLSPSHLSQSSDRRSVHGLWVNNNRLFQVVGVPLIFQDESGQPSTDIDGALLMANCITDRLTNELRKGSNCEITFVVNGSAIASTIPLGQRDELQRQLTTMTSENAFEMTLGDVAYRSWREPMRDPCSQTEVASMLIQMSEVELRDARNRTSAVMLGVLGSGLILAALASFLVSAAVTRPIAVLVDGVREVADGNLELSLNVKPRDEIGKLASAFNDMVKQLRSRRELERQVEQSQAASKAKSQFLANMSHEIRTPLNGVVGMTQLLMATSLNEQQRKYAGLVKKSADILTSLINDVLDLSKIEAGKVELESIPFSPTAVVSEVVELLSEKARQKGFGIRTELGPDVPRTVRGDPNRTRQILLNLVSNAVKFTEAGYVLVKIECQRRSALQVAILFSVSDTGIGIPSDRRDRLFKSFSQVDASTTRKHGGTGLGLAICKQLVELMGGSIGVDTDPNRGSTFWFTAMYATDTASNSGVNFITTDCVTAHSRERRATDRAIGVRILLVEDNEINQFVVAEMLANAGYACDVVDNGAKSVTAVRERPPYDLVLMDCQMPVMDGFEATRLIRKHEANAGVDLRRVPIVALTASAVTGDRQKCLEAGMNGYCSKPIDAQQLITTVESFVRRNYPTGRESAPARTEKSGLVPIEYTELIQRCSGNTTLAERVLDELGKKIAVVVSDLKSNVDKSDADTIARIAHGLKGAAGMAGAHALAQAAAKIEEFGRRGELERVSDQLNALAEAIRDCQQSIASAKCNGIHPQTQT